MWRLFRRRKSKRASCLTGRNCMKSCDATDTTSNPVMALRCHMRRNHSSSPPVLPLKRRDRSISRGVFIHLVPSDATTTSCPSLRRPTASALWQLLASPTNSTRSGAPAAGVTVVSELFAECTAAAVLAFLKVFPLRLYAAVALEFEVALGILHAIFVIDIYQVVEEERVDTL